MTLEIRYSPAVSINRSLWNSSVDRLLRYDEDDSLTKKTLRSVLHLKGRGVHGSFTTSMSGDAVVRLPTPGNVLIIPAFKQV